MSMTTTWNFCPNCKKRVAFEKESVNHILHLFITIFTLGSWGIVWLILSIANSLHHSFCKECGAADGLSIVPFYRTIENKVLFGVLSGLADKYEISVWILRSFLLSLTVLLFVFFTPVSLLLAFFYLLCGIFFREERPRKKEAGVSEKVATSPSQPIWQQERIKILEKKYNEAVNLSLENFHFFVGENYKEILDGNGLLSTSFLEGIITSQIEALSEENKKREIEIKVISSLVTNEKERNRKVDAINQEYSGNKKKIKRLQGNLSYLRSAFCLPNK